MARTASTAQREAILGWFGDEMPMEGGRGVELQFLILAKAWMALSVSRWLELFP
jgi:hypothetical protein